MESITISLPEGITADSCIYLVYHIDHARGRYCLKVVETEEELQGAIQAARARRARRAEMRPDASCPPFAYRVFRTRGGYEAFKVKLESERAKYEAQEYREHVTDECARLAREAEKLKLAQGVCGQFDGKVINARFYSRLGEVCGCTVFENYSRLNFTKFNEFDFCIYASTNTDNPTNWRWPSGSRLDGAAAVEVLENCISDRMDQIKEMRASVRHYAAYLRKVRKIEERLKELTKMPWCVRNYAKENHLTGFYGAKYIWQ